MLEKMGRMDVQLLAVLELCRDIELKCGELYSFFADNFREIPAATSLWRKTAGEESNHANQFTLAINLLRTGIIDSLTIDRGQGDQTLQTITQLLHACRQQTPSLTEALQIAISVEEQLEVFHLNAIAAFSDESHKKLFDAMMKADRRHRETISEALRTFGGARQ